MAHSAHLDLKKLSAAGALITLGIIFGDIGTSPLYVMRAIVGTHAISKELIYGGVSCVFWTLLIVTTVKYVYIAIKNDNKGEGGIFALYALVRRYKSPWLIFPALIGCSTLIADGFITPPISISSAVEGLKILNPDIQTVPIVILILIALFAFQQVGTQIVGKAFGPIMLVWFIMLASLGITQIIQHPEIISALNPYYAVRLLTHYPHGFWLLGAVFLCTTGGEALYSDLGHCGKNNIRFSWFFVLICLLINYLGQSAYLMQFEGQPYIPKSVFYGLMPEWFLPYGITIAAMATIIASQALITGAFTLVNEAMKLHLWINLKVNYPTQLKGQIYIPAINWFLLAGCITVVLIFREASNMEAAYGLAIIIDMLMTTTLLTFLFIIRKRPWWKILFIAIVFGFVEISFLISNASKFTHGGWFTFLISVFIFTATFVVYNARRIRQKHTDFVPLEDYVPMLVDLQTDETVPKEATNLVYLAMANTKRHIDSNIVYSIFRKRPKRADIYWFVHIDILDEPYAKRYSVDTIVPGNIFFVKLQFGFKVEHKVNLMFHKIVTDMIQNGEVDETSRYPSLRKHGFTADFKFILLNSRVSVDNEISPYKQWIIRTYRLLKKLSLPTYEDFGLELANIEVETVPINVGPYKDIILTRED